MALDSSHLQCAFAPGDSAVGQIMVYTSTDALATIEADGYFDTLVDQFRDDDFLLVGASDGHAVYRVTKTTGDIALTKAGSSLAAAVTALGGTLTGTVTGTMADITALSTSDTYTDAAVNAKITAINLQLKELQTVLNALIGALD